MKLLTLIISARAYGVETLLELAVLEQLSKPENQAGLSLKLISLNLGDHFDAVVMAVANLENIGLIKSRRGIARTVLGGMNITLTDKGHHLMYGKAPIETENLTLFTA